MNDLSEKEQLDELRVWWQENRAMILGGIALGIALILGFRMYTANQVQTALEASAQYENLVAAVADNELEPARAAASALFEEHGGTVYARQGRLAMARLYMDLGRDEDAAEVLRPLAASPADEPLELVARLRLGRVLLYQDKPGEVLELLQVPADTAFVARYHEILGDAHYALGNMEEAGAQWSAALADSRAQQTVDAELIRMKIDDLPEPAAAVDAAADAPPTPGDGTAGADDSAAAADVGDEAAAEAGDPDENRQ